VRAWRQDTHNTIPYVVGGVVLVIIIVLASMWDSTAQQRAARLAPPSADAGEPGPGPVTGTATGTAVPGAPSYPVPPLDLPHYHGIGLDHETSTREVTGA